MQGIQRYIKEAERELNNIENQRPLPNDPTKTNNDTVNKTTKRFEKEDLMKDKVAEGLITKNSRTLRFQQKPKIYKEGNTSYYFS